MKHVVGLVGFFGFVGFVGFVILIGVAGVVGVTGCKVTGTVQCGSDEHCDLSAGGACLRNPGTKRHWCSYPDSECPAGFRWSTLDVGDGVSGRCVDPLALDRTPPVIVGRTPSPDSQGVAPTTLVSVMFSEAMDPESVSAETLRLEDQGGNVIEASFVTAGAEVVLTPRVPLDPRLDYRITVTPEVTDLAGNGVPEAANWGFRTRDAAWSTPVLLELEQSKTATSIEAAASNGVIVVTWTFAPCNGAACTAADEIWAAVRKDGIWGAAVKLGTAPERLGLPTTAVDREGRALVCWSQEGFTSPGKIFVARYDGRTWSPAALLVEDRDRLLFAAQLELAADGSIDLLWTDQVDTTRRIWTTPYSAAAGWGAHFKLGDSLFGNMPTPRLAVDKISFVIREKTDSQQIFVNQRKMDSWNSSTKIADVSAPTKLLEIAASGDEATAIWATDHVFSRRLVNGVWEAVAQLDSITSPPPLQDSVATRNLAYLDDGEVVALWSTENDVWQAVRPPAQSWGPSFAIDADVQPVRDVQLMAGGRRALALWRTSDLIANEYSEPSGWRGAAPAENQATPVGDATVVYDSTTNTFVAVWLQANAAGLVDVLSSSYR